ncbi:MAG: endolytic transglycosylase MltG [Proteobacteria bacterium]|nr:endolytic transglycosylase MltG [Pseudomonadota bacterium]
MRSIAALFTFLFILLIGAGMAIFFVLPQLGGPGPLETQKDLVIARGNGASTIARQLEKEGVISNRWMFRLRYALAGQPELKAGEYLFNPHVSVQDTISMMAAGDVVIRKFTVAEGRTSSEIVEMLKKEPALTGEIATIPAEGSLAPDTYRFVYGDARQSVIARMQKAMQETVDVLWAQHDPTLPLKTQAEMVTLASIVEKETGVPAERSRVAGVYINRLRQNMLLQSDPTVIYGITFGLQPMGRPLAIADLQKSSPYNTYLLPGLPPGPIANPGKASLSAAANPEKHDFLYFVADGGGGHKFAVTIKEHEANVAAWRKFQKLEATPAIAPAAAQPGAVPPATAAPAAVQPAAAPPAKAPVKKARRRRH